MKKRSQLSLEGLFVTIVCALIILSFIQAAKSYGSREAYYKTAIARDIALLIDGLYSVPGDARIEYRNDASKYRIEVKDNEVKVYKTTYDMADITKGRYRFYGPRLPQILVVYPNILIIEKKNGRINLHD